jgi:hypothetical protein
MSRKSESGPFYRTGSESKCLTIWPSADRIDTTNAYEGDAADFGTNSDPLVGKRVGGVNVFGGDPAHPDNIIYDIGSAHPSGFGHPTCLGSVDPKLLPAVQ